VVCSSLNLSENHSADPELLAGQQFLRLRAVSDTVFLLFTTGVLDYESTPRISLLIECVDSTDFGDNPNIAPSEQVSRHIIRITVAVEDRNDNAPIFLNEKYFARIPEHSMKGAFVSQVEAFDADKGEFGNLTYHLDHLSPGQTPTGLPTRIELALTVDPKSGRIEVLHPNLLDRELSETFHIKVVATDKGGLSASAELVLELNDINDCAPVLIGSSELSLEENQRIDTVIGHIHFKDRDVGKNARIHVLSTPANSGAEVHKYIRLTGDPSFRYATSRFNNSSHLGRAGITDDDLVGDREVRAILVSQMPVDREIYATLFFEIIAFDEEDGYAVKPRPFNIYLREGDASSLETLPIAIDADAQPNGIVEYRLIQISPPVSYPERSSFEVSVSKSSGINPSDKLPTEINAVQISTPKLVQTRALDYENESERKFHAVLLAVDGGTPALTGSLTIMIHLLDINDNSPVFVHSEEEVYINIPENSTLNNEPFFTARAIDADSGENGRVSYAMSPLASADVTRKFFVDSITGEIRIRQSLDYEIYSERHFVLPLVAKDSGSPQRSSTTSLFIKVRDVNDNIPSLIVQENNTIPEGEFLKKPVVKFYIKDEDEVSQGKVSRVYLSDFIL
ncbi:hypothetical protein AHF37_02989, partial [Paragonimus kellicotti]